MKNKFYSCSLAIAVIGFFSVFFGLETLKAEEIVFDNQKCLQSFVSQGLSRDKAKIWCNYKQDCLKASQKEGLPADAAESVCNCVISEFKKLYSTEQFQDLTQKAKKDKTAAEKLREVGEACFDNILFED